MIIHKKNKKEVKNIFYKAIDIGIDFKLQDPVVVSKIKKKDIVPISANLPHKGESLKYILGKFKKDILPYCTNFSSNKFLGFPDAGNSVGAITGAILSDFLQQNLINQSFCAPSATFVEIAVIQWLRQAVRYPKIAVTNVWSAGGIITTGGTMSNTIAIMLARENKAPGTMESGVTKPSSFKIVVPKGIGHYSVKSAQMWIGCGYNLIEVETKDFRYDLVDLKKKVLANKNSIMVVIAYAGDSRTMTVDHLDKIATIVRKINPKIWLHADACHGFSLGFSKKLKYKIKGIEKFDSISTDPHKVMLTPYTISALLLKDPEKIRTITSKSDLIMQEDFAFGQITPFMGSKPWISLKLWFMMKNFGKKGLDDLITKRHLLSKYLDRLLRNDPDFTVLNKLDINSVTFFYTGGIDLKDIPMINSVNQRIHREISKKGEYHLHQFSIPDSGIFKKGEVVHPLRFMCGNPNVTKRDIDTMIEYIRSVGKIITDHNE